MLKLHRVESGNHAGNGVVNRQPIGKELALLKPVQVRLTKVLDILPSFSAADHGAERQEQNIKQGVGHFGGLSGILEFGKVFRESVDGHEMAPEKGA